MTRQRFLVSPWCSWLTAYSGGAGSSLRSPEATKCLHGAFRETRAQDWALLAPLHAVNILSFPQKKQRDCDSYIFPWEQGAEFPNKLEREGGNFSQGLFLSGQWHIRSCLAKRALSAQELPSRMGEQFQPGLCQGATCCSTCYWALGQGLRGEKEKALMGDGLFLMSPNLLHKLSEIF